MFKAGEEIVLGNSLVNGDLPQVPSELIRLAMADLKKCEEAEKYIINMDEWHEPAENGTCAVCLAGAVMAQTFLADPADELTPKDYWEETYSANYQALSALDSFRKGNIREGLNVMGLDSDEWLTRIHTSYDYNKEIFKAEMYTLADDFEKNGL